MSIVWAGGRPVKGEKIRNRKYVPKNYGEPCATWMCQAQPTKHYKVVVQDEDKEIPFCLGCARNNNLA